MGDLRPFVSRLLFFIQVVGFGIGEYMNVLVFSFWDTGGIFGQVACIVS